LQAAREGAVKERAEFGAIFNSFLLETKPLVSPGSRHPEAALYRHAWRRAAILGIIYQQRSDPVRTEQFRELEKIASKRYFEVAPSGLYGKAPLVMNERSGIRLLEFEKKRLFPTENKQGRNRPFACIYIGTCAGRAYVGQTVGAPEYRWTQHRFGRTGPFKNGELYVDWKVIEGEVDLPKLNERESYYIGLDLPP
jgi:hypothetical protein